jgi:hypothetical protein
MSELTNAQWALRHIENGSAEEASINKTLETLDPLIVYFIFRYIRERYQAGHPSADGVLNRMLNLTGNYTGLVKRAKEGEKDPVREWFDDTHRMKEFFDKGDELMTLLVDKIES